MAHSRPIGRPVVLVVEDEPLQRMMAVDLVEDAGFEVVEASNADEAILILESRTDILVIFTDIDMPGSMDGIRLAAAVHNRWPPIAIIVTSGLKAIGELDLPEHSVFFSKPYDSDRVSAHLRQFGY